MTAMAVATAVPVAGRRSIGIPVEWLIAGLICLFILDNLLLLAFFGLSPFATTLLVAVAWGVVEWLMARPSEDSVRVPLTTLAVALAISLGIFVLGGEGRFFYANPDWQIRDAVLADLASHDWPFAYDVHGLSLVLRAPLGMYLLPALAGKGSPHEIVLLLSNASRLALLLALAWQLYQGTAKRLIVLGIFLLFSGWDALGLWLKSPAGDYLSWDHIEQWNAGLQYSSNITLAFWVPQHALAGWTCALLFVLWRRGLAPIGAFAASIPLLAIWSPLAIMGAVPFALLAGITALARRSVGWRDVALPVLALLIALPSLLYVQLDAASLGAGPLLPDRLSYALVLMFEVFPFLILPLLAPRTDSTERLTLWIVLGCLLLMPLWRIGVSTDFQMRASIMPLALLAFGFADWVTGLMDERPRPIADLGYAVVALSIGAVTPALEVRRALVNRPSPEPRCSLVGVWTKQTGLVVPMASYLVHSGALPDWLGPIPVQAGRKDPARCWDHDWVRVKQRNGGK